MYILQLRKLEKILIKKIINRIDKEIITNNFINNIVKEKITKSTNYYF